MTINETFQEIVTLTQEIITKGLSVDEKWPDRNGSRISWQDQKDLSIALKNVPYSDKYNIFQRDRNYNLKMLDGAMIQMLYEFNVSGRELRSHRLAYLPSPMLERYESDPVAHEEVFFGDSEFHDLIEKNIVAFPIRVDYSSNNEIYKEIDHPYTHATFGEYESCRIPVKAPLTPSIFVNFVLRNFYNYAFRSKGAFCHITHFRYPATIGVTERKLLHLSIDND